MLFDQSFSGLEISPAQIAHPIRQSDPTLLKTLLDHATQLLAEIDQHESWAHRVKEPAATDDKTRPARKFIAEKLGATPVRYSANWPRRVLGYRELLDELRLEIAQDYLQDSSLNIDEIGCMLPGFQSRVRFIGVSNNGRAIRRGSFRSFIVVDVHWDAYSPSPTLALKPALVNASLWLMLLG